MDDSAWQYGKETVLREPDYTIGRKTVEFHMKIVILKLPMQEQNFMNLILGNHLKLFQLQLKMI